MKSKWRNILILSAVVGLCAVPLLTISGKDKNGEERFQGSDDQAKDMITQIRPDYKPWFNSLWTPPSSEIESLLFALQAGIGAGVMGYYFGIKRGQALPRRSTGSGATGRQSPACSPPQAATHASN